MNETIFDKALALQRANGKLNLVAELMTMLQKDLPGQKARLQQLWQENNLEELQRLVHKIHGGTRYCGVPQLQQCSETLETILLQQADNYHAAYQDLLTAIDNLLAINIDLAING